MHLSADTIRAAAMKRWETQDMVHDYCSEYGERGYSINWRVPDDEATPMILRGDWNERGPRKHPRLADQLEAQGVELVWHDEWEFINDKAYRTNGDSAFWESSIAWWDSDWLTPDDDFETWVRYANEESKCINSTQVPDLERKLVDAGFTRVPEDDYYEQGWHPGQTDDPDAIMATLRAEHGDDAEIVPVLIENSMFYFRFAFYYRIPEQEEA